MTPIIMMAVFTQRHHLFLVGFLSFCVDSFAQGQKNNTLIFTKENTIRNCTCPNDISKNDCDYSLANLICNCKTVLPYTIDKTYYDNLTIWFTETFMLGMLLNFTAVDDLKLSLCGTIPLSTKYLTIWGVRQLQIRSEINGQLQEQSLTIYSSRDSGKQGKLKMPCKERDMITHIAVLDTSLFNGYGPLKSYSVENVSNITDHFPHLPYLDTFFTMNNKSCIVTFIY
ncbi:polycystin-1-interacting protein 1 [Elgaria multicarinata webbii]|uniref:polycystin-1-interacting protein 1 n=1 Tax=Elgaria multicarinata webbii TaxID=159646 RepID=UPI002FCCDC91